MSNNLRLSLVSLVNVAYSLTAIAIAGLAQAQTQAPGAASAASAETEKPQATENDDRWVLQLSPYTKHYSPSPEHKPVRLIGVERLNGNSKFWGGDRSLWGASYFSNSFGQPSGYVYYGGMYNDLFGQDRLFFKWTAGVIYGYKPPYENKVPFNRHGWSPGLIAGFGYKLTPQLSVQINALGVAAAMLAFTYELPSDR